MHPRSAILGLASFASGGATGHSFLAPENYYTRITRPPGAPTPVLDLSLASLNRSQVVLMYGLSALEVHVQEAEEDGREDRRRMAVGGPPLPS